LWCLWKQQKLLPSCLHTVVLKALHAKCSLEIANFRSYAGGYANFCTQDAFSCVLAVVVSQKATCNCQCFKRRRRLCHFFCNFACPVECRSRQLRRAFIRNSWLLLPHYASCGFKQEAIRGAASSWGNARELKFWPDVDGTEKRTDKLYPNPSDKKNYLYVKLSHEMLPVVTS
jgi:hypothetical protein